MDFLRRFFHLSKFELGLWIFSLTVTVGTFFIFKSDDVFTLISSVIGVTALIYIAKGHILGQILTIVFALFYGIVSLKFAYYGEVITYLGMTAPSATVALISWIRHPYKPGESYEVKVAKMTPFKCFLLFLTSFAVTLGFYFILKALGNANLFVSTLSIFTSFLASGLMILRHPTYALAYSANDIVLIVLWVLASLENPAFVPMVACFSMFFLNDIYGFISWQKMKHKQI